MVRLTVLSGPRLGQEFTAVRFPLTLGRNAKAGWQLEEAGVWPEHAVIQRDNQEGFFLESVSEAILVVNGTAVSRVLLRGGDVIELGSVRLGFGLSETQQRSFRIREWATWIGVGCLCLGQVLLVYLLLP